MEDVLGRGLLELEVPHESHAVGFVRRVLVVVVGGHQQLGVLGEAERSKQAEQTPVKVTGKREGPPAETSPGR